jgi:hypothetical protein
MLCIVLCCALVELSHCPTLSKLGAPSRLRSSCALVIRAALSPNNINWVVKFESVSVKMVKKIETTKLRFRQ